MSKEKSPENQGLKLRENILFGGVPLSYYCGQLSDFCVYGFAFLSGYGHYVQFEQKQYFRKRMKGLLSLLCSYWLIVILFTGVSYVGGHGDFMPGGIGKFASNFFLLEHSFNGAWWYMFTYVVLVVISPLLLRFIKSNNLFAVIIPTFIVYCAGFYVRYYVDTTNWLLLKFGPFGMTLFEYMLGAVAFKYKILSHIYRRIKMFCGPVRCATAVATIIALGYIRTKIIGSVFVAPASGFVLMAIFHFWRKPKCVQRMFLYIGDHSTNIWLTHMFFLACLFKNFVYIAKYPFLIFGLMLIITLSISHALKVIEIPIQRSIAKL